jgi:hypothetical protein
MKYQKLFALSIAILAAAVPACSKSAEAPTAPTASTVSDDYAAPDGSTLKVTAPKPAMPLDGVTVEDTRPQLEVENASPRFGENLPVSYVFEVFNTENQLVYRSGPVGQGPHGRTWHVLNTPLNFDSAYRWRAYAIYDGHRGPASETTNFRTFNRYGASCANAGSELAIVRCRRAQYGYMSEADRVEFLHRIAHDLNKAATPFAPWYGVLLKSSGNQCHGYACDIICSNAGNVHRQWDVLSDESGRQVPLWSHLDRVAPRGCQTVQ